MTTNLLDQVILVDETDHPIGVMDKVAAHRGAAQLHRAISVYLFNQHGELLVQQRSAQKIVGAGLWANTCCGNVRPGESYLECASRRLKEELGISAVELSPVYKFMYQVKCNEEFSEREIDQVFVGRFDGEARLNPQEVAQAAWVALSDLQTGQAKLALAPWFELMLNNPELMEVVSA